MSEVLNEKWVIQARLRGSVDPDSWVDLAMYKTFEEADDALVDLRQDPMWSHNEYRLTRAVIEVHDELAMDVHTFFSLSYCSYYTVSRSLLQSMPVEWQHRFTAMARELAQHFGDLGNIRYEVRYRDPETQRYAKDPIPHYDRGRTYIPGVDEEGDEDGEVR